MKNKALLVAVGDIFMGEHPVTLGHGVDSKVLEKGPDFLFQKTADILRKGDIVFGNLENIIAETGRDKRRFITNCFRARRSTAEALARAGVNLLSLANNHTMQHGVEAVREATELLDSCGIRYSGINERNPDSAVPVFFNVSDIRVGFLAYSFVSQQYHLDTPVVCRGNTENIKADVARLRDVVDHVVVSLHWGDEFVEIPSPEQVRIGRALIDAGVDIILGHHSHVLQGIERYKNGVIVYSLGSFIKDLWQKQMRESIVFRCELTKTGIGAVEYIPIWINDQYQPEVLEGVRGSELLGRLNRLSRDLQADDLNGYVEKQAKYLQYVQRLLRRDRLDTYFHYLTHCFRYNPKVLMQNFALVIRRRMAGKNY
jgi:poly-gamma-glutamate synthesis protein (capsule biosynthesis protein)